MTSTPTPPRRSWPSFSPASHAPHLPGSSAPHISSQRAVKSRSNAASAFSPCPPERRERESPTAMQTRRSPGSGIAAGDGVRPQSARLRRLGARSSPSSPSLTVMWRRRGQRSPESIRRDWLVSASASAALARAEFQYLAVAGADHLHGTLNADVRSTSRCFEGDLDAPDRPVRRSPGDHHQGPAGRASQAVTCACASRCSSRKVAMSGPRSPGAEHLERAPLPLAVTAVVSGAGAGPPAAAARAMRQARRRINSEHLAGYPGMPAWLLLL